MLLSCSFGRRVVSLLVVPAASYRASLLLEVSNPPRVAASVAALAALLFVLPFFGRFPEVCHRLDFFA